MPTSCNKDGSATDIRRDTQESVLVLGSPVWLCMYVLQHLIDLLCDISGTMYVRCCIVCAHRRIYRCTDGHISAVAIERIVNPSGLTLTASG